jgi:hypothetical protein
MRRAIRGKLHLQPSGPVRSGKERVTRSRRSSQPGQHHQQGRRDPSRAGAYGTARAWRSRDVGGVLGQNESAAPSHSIKLLAATDEYLKAKEATAYTKRAVEFDRERLEVVKRVIGDVRLSAITGQVIEPFQASIRVEGASNRTVNMDVGALRHPGRTAALRSIARPAAS